MLIFQDVGACEHDHETSARLVCLDLTVAFAIRMSCVSCCSNTERTDFECGSGSRPRLASFTAKLFTFCEVFALGSFLRSSTKVLSWETCTTCGSVCVCVCVGVDVASDGCIYHGSMVSMFMQSQLGSSFRRSWKVVPFDNPGSASVARERHRDWENVLPVRHQHVSLSFLLGLMRATLTCSSCRFCDACTDLMLDRCLESGIRNKYGFFRWCTQPKND